MLVRYQAAPRSDRSMLYPPAEIWGWPPAAGYIAAIPAACNLTYFGLLRAGLGFEKRQQPVAQRVELANGNRNLAPVPLTLT